MLAQQNLNKTDLLFSEAIPRSSHVAKEQAIVHGCLPFLEVDASKRFMGREAFPFGKSSLSRDQDSRTQNRESPFDRGARVVRITISGNFS